MLVVGGEAAVGLTVVATDLPTLALGAVRFVVNFLGINKPWNAALGLFSTFTMPFRGLGCNDFGDDDMSADSNFLFVVW